jgi:hypothetical protein
MKKAGGGVQMALYEGHFSLAKSKWDLTLMLPSCSECGPNYVTVSRTGNVL